MQYHVVVTHECSPEDPDHGEVIFNSLCQNPNCWGLDDVSSDGIEFSRRFDLDAFTDAEEQAGYAEALDLAMAALNRLPNGQVCVYGDGESAVLCP